MTTPSTEPEEPREFDGPDPRDWPANAELWGMVEDIRAIDAMLALLKGETAQDDRGPARGEARAFLTEAGYQAREVLSRMLLSLHGVEIPDKPAHPFGKAGKARAFGADRTPGAAEPKT